MSSLKWPWLAAASDRRVNAAIIVASMVAGALYAFVMGEDANWDWQNYHEYNVWALINGGYDVDVVPSGFQTYFNPLAYYPYYYLRHYLPGPIGGIMMGAVHGLNLAVVYWLLCVVLGRLARSWALLAGIVIAATGSMTLSETGTSFADILTAALIVAGGALILSTQASSPLRLVLGGVLIGAAVGLKLTNVVYALGAVFAVLAAPRVAVSLAWLALGGVVGTVLTGGAWSYMLWRELGNPIFPLFNGVFTGPELLPVNFLDLQFMPKGLLDALAYPFYWLIGENRSSEFPFRDARFAVVMVLIPLAVAARIIRRAPLFSRSDIQLFLMFGVSYAAWLGLFAIHRYAVTLEILCAPMIVVLVLRIAGEPREDASPRQPAGSIIAAALAVAIALWSQPWDWGHRPWSQKYQPKIAEELRQPANYFMLGKPLSYVASVLAPGSRFYQLADIALRVRPGGMFDRRVRDGLDARLPGGVWELHASGEARNLELLAPYGLTVDATKPCIKIEGVVLGTAIEACPLMKKG